MDAPSARSERIAHEVLAIGFRAWPGTVGMALVFAGLTIAFMWEGLPHGFLAGWYVGFAVILFARLALARSFRQAQPSGPDTRRWAYRAAIAYGITGLAWGALGAAAMAFAPGRMDYVMVIAFLITIFAVLQSQAGAAHPLVFNAFMAGAWAPVIVMSIVTPAPNWTLRLLLEAIVVLASFLVGRAGNRAVAQTLAIRYEKVDLLHDLTHQTEELDKANSAKTRFFAAASHDLRQPMQAIVLLVESLHERVKEPEARRIVANIHSSVNSMAALVNALLDISRFDAGTVKPERSHFRVANVLERLRGTFAQEAAEKGLTFVVRPSRAIVATDHILLYRILANITSNAVRYTERGKVVVGCRRRRDGLEIGVWDTGPGIPEEDLTEVFREFHQLGNPHRDREQGLGLGLAIVERTAALLDHPLVVRSRVGRGSVFAVKVPYGDEAGIQASERTRGAEWTTLEGCRVLVVEDEHEIRGAMTLLLESWGCAVVAAATGQDVRAWLARSPAAPDVVMADYRLPGEDNGIQVIHAVRNAYPGANGILVTGDIAPEVLREAEASGFRILHKPLRPARLRALLGNVWRERSAAQRTPEAAAAQ
jgi:signal transduction histidine kinase/CheY-like chemotaxis protein